MLLVTDRACFDKRNRPTECRIVRVQSCFPARYSAALCPKQICRRGRILYKFKRHLPPVAFIAKKTEEAVKQHNKKDKKREKLKLLSFLCFKLRLCLFGFFGFFFVFFFLVEQDFVHREVKEELNCAANRVGDEQRKAVVDIFADKEALQCRGKPSGEAN